MTNGEPTKKKILQTPQKIEIRFHGYKAKAEATIRRLGRPSYDCVVSYRGEDVTFETICREIITKCYKSGVDERLAKNIIYVFLKAVASRPLTTSDSVFSEYIVLDNKLKKIIEVNSQEVANILQGESMRNSVLDDMNVGKYTFQEMINIISYIAIIEEFNYPKIENEKKYRGRSDCFGRYIEVLFGNQEELENLLQQNAFRNGAHFIEDKRFKKYYLTRYIDKDRIELSQGRYF